MHHNIDWDTHYKSIISILYDSNDAMNKLSLDKIILNGCFLHHLIFIFIHLYITIILYLILILKTFETNYAQNM